MEQIYTYSIIIIMYFSSMAGASEPIRHKTERDLNGNREFKSRDRRRCTVSRGQNASLLTARQI